MLRRCSPRGAGLGAAANLEGARRPSGFPLGPSLFSLDKGVGAGIAPEPKNRERWGAAQRDAELGKGGKSFRTSL